MQRVVGAPVSSGEVQAAGRYSLRDPDMANKFFEALQNLGGTRPRWGRISSDLAVKTEASASRISMLSR
jgi:hypothetical protein